MTSRIVANALLRDLSFCDGAAQRTNAAHAFRFALDFEPERVWPDLAFDTSSPLARYPVDARDEVAEIIGAVARVAGTGAPKALDFINAHMETALVCRSDAIEGASSASNRELVGLCVLTNMHAPADRILVCAEALLHESIHQYLYKTERDDGNFCDLSEARTYRSPWSGNRIPLHSLIHACFVWYGLLSLWSQLARSAEDDDELSLLREKASRVMFGFSFVRQMFAGPSFPLASVEPDIVAVIDRIAQIVPSAGPVDLEPSTLQDSLRRWESGAWVGQLAKSLQRIGASEPA
jgi:HEXXH motif-containing protein